MPTYNIIGDIHGRTNWKGLVDEDCINVFVGDYFAPYTFIPFFELQRNFQEIIDLKKRMPDKVILLYGNHDYEYLPGITEESSRYDSLNASKITNLLTENESLFYGVAYAIGESYIVTHAGITKPWIRKYLPEAIDYLPGKMAEAINTLWLNNKSAFGFRENAEPFDYYGESIGHSPIWMRPISLGYCNIYKRTNVIQIVGHSHVPTITEDDNAIFVDCLGTRAKSKRITVE